MVFFDKGDRAEAGDGFGQGDESRRQDLYTKTVGLHFKKTMGSAQTEPIQHLMDVCLGPDELSA